MTEERSHAASEPPPEDLKRERDAFLQQFFKRGAQLTEELVRENERLVQNIRELESENARLRAHVASDAAIRDLLRKIEELEHEKIALATQSRRIDEMRQSHTQQFAEIESELSNIASLYIASGQLHASRTVRGVLRSARELLAQLLGAESFGLFWSNDDRTQLVAIAGDSLESGDLSATEGVFAEVFSKGEPRYWDLSDTSKGTLESPAAIVPIKIDGRSYGLIVVVATLPQKTALLPADDELFRMLSAQLGPALLQARFFADAGRKVPALDALFETKD